MTEAALSRSEAPSLAKKSHCTSNTIRIPLMVPLLAPPSLLTAEIEPRATSSHRETKREFTYLSVSEESVFCTLHITWSLHYLIAKRKGDELGCISKNESLQSFSIRV